MTERRAPVQGDGPYWTPPNNWQRRKYRTQVPGTIAWSEHLAVWEAYAQRHGTQQDAERIAARSGFSFYEAEDLIGCPLKTWQPRLVWNAKTERWDHVADVESLRQSQDGGGT